MFQQKNYSRTSAEMSFYFTVTEVSLQQLDPLQPVCEGKILCADKSKCKKLPPGIDFINQFRPKSFSGKLEIRLYLELQKKLS
jgi:hypothetical protein